MWKIDSEVQEVSTNIHAGFGAHAKFITSAELHIFSPHGFHFDKIRSFAAERSTSHWQREKWK